MKKSQAKYNGYKTSLILSAIVMVLLFVVIIVQILQLKSSGDQVVSHLKQARFYNKLVLHLELIEQKFNSNELSIQYLDSINTENKAILFRLANSDPGHKEFINNHNYLYGALKKEVNSITNETDNSDQIRNLINRGKLLKKNLIKHHDKLAFENAAKFSDDNALFPKMFIASTIIGLVILLISLYKIFEARKEVNEKSSILDAILNNTNDIANFYKPIYSSDGKLKDFEITYASKANLSLTHIPFDKLVGSMVSKTYPFLKESGLFHQLVNAYETQSYFEKILEIPIEGNTRIFNARYIPVKQGLQVMVTELTKLYSKQEELEKMYKELFIKNRLFQEAEETALLGSYVWYMRDDETIMSDNVYRILGYKPQEFPMSAQKFREFAHPDDHELYDEAVNAAYENNEPIEFIFRIITTTKEIKYIYTKGDFSERDGKQIMVGVIQDVTKRVAYENQLKDANIELIRRNNELDAFNRVASHDLQEPLRKVQMFISRIKDSEYENLGEKGKLYFKKIESASKRMRKLINNLLAFSRIDNKDYDFEEVNLNTVFDSVLDTFSESTAHLDVDITIQPLPTIYAIPFLMEQLFTNLIGNAIKYRSKDETSKITVESSKVHGKQIPHDFMKTYAYYHRIKVTDNGIGFNQEDSEKIFELFKRLHTKSDYSGTGLGLAICHKIVLKHHGFIYATSVPHKGSVFTIYLPSGKLRTIPTKIKA